MARRAQPAGPRTADARRREFVSWLQNRFFLRFHMTIILGLTFLAGLGVTKLLLEAGNENLAVRYGAAVVGSYMAFLLLLKAWLWYMDDRPGDASDDGRIVDLVDAADIVTEFGRASASSTNVAFQGAGGSFGGGGASGSFGGGSSLLDVGGDDEGCALVVVIVVVVVGILAAALYLVYAGPTILAEVAFEALLASSLLPGARKAESPGWVGGAVKATFLPFLAIFVLATGFGWFAARECPGARRVPDVLECAGLH